MKERRLMFHVQGRKFYLAPPRRPGGPYYIRFEPPSNCRKGVRRVHRSLRTSVIAAAKDRAKRIIEPILNGQWEIAEKLKSKSGYAKIGEIVERYQSQAEDRPGTVRNNISALRLIIRTVHGGDPDVQSSSVLTADLLRRFERARMAGGKTEIARRRARSSIRSYVVQARSLVAPRKMRFYEGVHLPDLTSFRNERIEMPKRSKPRALDTGVIAAINAAAKKLAATDPAVYVVFLMFSRLGLRNVEIRNARWSWIENSRIGIIDRPDEDFYPKGSEGWVPIASDVLQELMRFRHLSTDDYIVPGATMTERKIAVDRRHSAWVGQWIKDRSKTSYELRRYAGSLVYQATRDILKVRDFLRHASVETTQQWYAYLLEDVPSIGMNDFVPTLASVRD
jgi:site-specific recombinase XerC